MNVIVIWQSLVVSAYRSFWVHLANSIKGSVTAVVPHEFWELGGQMVTCAPFSEQWEQRIETHVLKVRAPHIQMVWFQGLARVFRSFARRSRQSATTQSSPTVLVALMEPYSLSALFVFLLARVFLPRGTRILFYSLQNIYKEFSLPLRLIQNFIFASSPSLLALSQEVTDVLRKQGYKGRIIRFPLWADSSLFYLNSAQSGVAHSSSGASPSQHPAAATPKRIRVGFCGAVTESKGVPDLLAALEMLSPEELSRIHFEIAGGGPVLEEARNCLTALSSRGLEFTLHGPVPATALPQFFNALDLLVVPSRTESHWKEQFGRVIVEAWACGATVIGSHSGEIPVLLAQPELIFEERNPQALLHVLRGVLARGPSAEVRAQNVRNAQPYLDLNVAAQFARELSALAR